MGLVAGCASERARDPQDLTTWQDDVASVLAARCGECHTGDDAAAGYDLSTYNGALGVGSDDVANAIAGDAGSTILTTLIHAAGDDPHVTLQDILPLLEAWVVDSDLAYFDAPPHPAGFLNPADPSFHGAELQAEGWDFALCQRCHGDDYGGGTSGKACLTCHDDGPTACDTCHGQPPETGAHHTHVAGGPLDRRVPCGECHVVPTRWDDPGHILLADGTVDPPPAEVVLGPLAARDVDPPVRTAPPSFDPATKTCSAVYCHGGIFTDAEAAHPAPMWTGADQAACGSCHGRPPASHATSDCATCHPRTIDAAGQLDLTTHLDGVIDVGDGSGQCTGCHGDVAVGPAPPRALDGSRATTVVAVGAHQSHLLAPHGLRGPMACTECHLVPATVTAVGHIDSALPAEVFPTGAGVLARADSANPVWDHDAATCSGVYCHGGGASLSSDANPGFERTPTWTVVGGGEAVCGACHGIPPAGVAHTPDMQISDCTTCHPSVDQYGGIILTGPPDALTSLHIDGHVDLR
ncbi:MAG: CxxxxCH/CxxCH domain-containing protein [Myxococcales bacterium]|nr:CxxxxCH/CxxCH domain-containing protein [Myxococcales bacterium]